MWKPPERIKHELPEARWPTAEEAARSLLFSPVDVGPVRLESRTWVPAMVPWRATEDGHVTDDVLAWYERQARGRPGALVLEATGIRDIPSGPLLRIGDDRFVPGLARLVDTVRQASDGHTRLFIQIVDFLTIRRRPEPEKFFRKYLKLTDRHRQAVGPGHSDEEVREILMEFPDAVLEAVLDERELESLRMGYRERVTDMHLPHIPELPRVLPGLFADAAERAREAGFDGVELHYAHAYTMASFLSALNDRDDGYGGPRENRVRLPLEVYEAVRERLGDDFAVGCRMLTDDCIEGGSDVEDAAYFAARFATAGMDFLSLSRGGKFEDAKQPRTGWAAYPYTGPSGYECMPTAISDEQGPFELVTYRWPGHAHHDDDRFHGNPDAGIQGYELAEEAATWAAADPLELYERRLQALGVLEPGDGERMRREAEEEVESAARVAAAAPWPQPSDYRERVEAPRRVPAPRPAEAPETRRMAYDEAVRDALACAMEADDGVFVLGEDVGGRYGGAFGVTRGLAKRFGDERCLNTPLAESAIVGCAVGAALMGLRPVVEMQFADFLAPGFNALVNNAAKVYWRWGRPVPLVVRLPYGGATGDMKRLLGGGPYHSQCPEMWFLRTPGFRVVAPATPADAKGLMLAAIRDDNPVIYLEAKGLYGFFRTDLREEVALGADVEVPLGEAAVRREGDDVTLLTYGAMVWTALDAAEEVAADDIAVEVVDLRSLWPLDEETIRASVEKTGRVLVLHEDTRRGGLAGELAARIADEHFWFLDAPIRRVTAPDTPVPYSPPLEHDFLPKAQDVVAAVRRLVRE